jgi:hypothetical protein
MAANSRRQNPTNRERNVVIPILEVKDNLPTSYKIDLKVFGTLARREPDMESEIKKVESETNANKFPSIITNAEPYPEQGRITLLEKERIEKGSGEEVFFRTRAQRQAIQKWREEYKSPSPTRERRPAPSPPGKKKKKGVLFTEEVEKPRTPKLLIGKKREDSILETILNFRDSDSKDIRSPLNNNITASVIREWIRQFLLSKTLCCYDKDVEVLLHNKSKLEIVEKIYANKEIVKFNFITDVDYLLPGEQLGKQKYFLRYNKDELELAVYGAQHSKKYNNLYIMLLYNNTFYGLVYFVPGTTFNPKVDEDENDDEFKTRAFAYFPEDDASITLPYGGALEKLFTEGVGNALLHRDIEKKESEEQHARTGLHEEETNESGIAKNIRKKVFLYDSVKELPKKIIARLDQIEREKNITTLLAEGNIDSILSRIYTRGNIFYFELITDENLLREGEMLKDGYYLRYDSLGFDSYMYGSNDYKLDINRCHTKYQNKREEISFCIQEEDLKYPEDGLREPLYILLSLNNKVFNLLHSVGDNHILNYSPIATDEKPFIDTTMQDFFSKITFSYSEGTEVQPIKKKKQFEYIADKERKLLIQQERFLPNTDLSVWQEDFCLFFLTKFSDKFFTFEDLDTYIVTKEEYSLFYENLMLVALDIEIPRPRNEIRGEELALAEAEAEANLERWKKAQEEALALERAEAENR